MTAEELANYLEELRAPSIPFSREELSEPLISAYDIVTCAVRDQCTVLEVTPRRVVWLKTVGGEIVGEFVTPINFKPYFQKIVDRDPMLRAHLETTRETATGVQYRIV